MLGSVWAIKHPPSLRVFASPRTGGRSSAAATGRTASKVLYRNVCGENTIPPRPKTQRHGNMNARSPQGLCLAAPTPEPLDKFREIGRQRRLETHRRAGRGMAEG